jgi:hypothetical protein
MLRSVLTHLSGRKLTLFLRSLFFIFAFYFWMLALNGIARVCASLTQLLNLATLSPFAPPYSIVLELDWNGQIIRSWHSNQRDIAGFSEAKIIVSCVFFLSNP